MVRDRFSRFEAHIERLVEGSFSRLFSGHLHPHEIAVQLARAMEDNVQVGEDGQAIAPHEYVVALNPDDYDALLTNEPKLAQALEAEVVEMARAAGLHLATGPSVQLVPDEGVASHRASVRAGHAEALYESTQGLDTLEAEPGSGPGSLEASLVTGKEQRVIPLGLDVMNIGRSRDNHIVLDDASVSRQHAQLRFRFGRFVLYDLDSQRGTVVNGNAVQEAILQQGDVVSLGEVRLIYTEDSLGAPDDPSPGSTPGLDETDAHPSRGSDA